MEARIVVSFRAIGGAGRPFLERARALSVRCAAIGGVHIGLDVLKTTYAFEPARFAEVLDLAIVPGPDTEGEEPPWAIGVAQGDLRKVTEEGSPILASGLLWWGPPFVAASALAGLARMGEILCAQTVPALRAGQLVTSGLRIARDGTLRVRGARVDRRQPWKHQAAKNLERMREPRLFTGHLPPVSMVPEKLLVVRGDPGSGGTRYVVELARRAQKSLLLSPVGSGFEPFGALRRALGRVASMELDPLLLELSPSLEALVAGRGVTLEEATKLVSAHLWPKPGQTSVLVVDDAKAVDAATLEAVVRAVRASPSIAAIARLDATSSVPSILAQLPRSMEVEIPALSREGAEEIVARATGGALDALARARWARLGGGSPLAVLEALTTGIASGDVAWSADRASPRSRATGRGEVRPASKWIRQRANAESGSGRALLSTLAVVGGEANVGFLGRVLDRAKIRIDLPATLDALEHARWIVRTQEAAEEADVWVAFPSRSHHKTLFNTLDDEARRALHRAVARLIDEEQGVLGKVEGAWHAAQAGETTAAAALFLAAARKAAEMGLEASTTQLIAFARRVDPGCEEAAVSLLASALDRSPSAHPAAVSMPPGLTAPPVPLFVPAAPAIPIIDLPIATLVPAGPMTVVPVGSLPPREPATPAVAVTVVPSAARTALPPPVVLSAAALADLPSERDDDWTAQHTAAAVPAPTFGELQLDLEDLEAQELGPDDLVEVMPSLPPPAPRGSDMPPARESLPPASNGPGGQVALRLSELARDALLAADNAALERWVDGLRATGESPVLAERLRAMAWLGRGDIGDALRVLRRMRARLDANDHARRCQTSLALGVALSVDGRPQEALLETLDALARARQVDDEQGARACLAFLAKLYSSVEREADAALIRDASP